MTWIDYKHIKAQVKFDQVLSYYGIELRKSGSNHLAGRCPLPDHAGDRSNKTAFHIDINKNAFNCFTHCGGGNVIDFVVKMEKMKKEDFRKAALKLHELFLIDDSSVKLKSKSNDSDKSVISNKTNLINKPLAFELKGLNSNNIHSLYKIKS